MTDQVAALKDRIEYLEAENQNLKTALFGYQTEARIDRVCRTLRVSRLTARTALAIMDKGFAPREVLFDMLYGDDLDQPDIKIIDVEVCLLRRKLKPVGIKIDKVWGVGYSVTKEAKTAFWKLTGLEAP